MKKRLFIGLLLVCTTATMVGQKTVTSYYSLALRGGYDSMEYGLKDGTMSGSIAYGAELEYALFFHKNAGIGIGLDFQRVGSTGTLNTTLLWNDVIDTDGEVYNHVVNLYNWSEKQKAFHLELPVTLQAQVDFNQSCGLLLKAGAAYSLMLQQQSNAGGTIEHLGNYDRWALQLDIPEHGFYIEKDFTPDYTFGYSHSCTFRFSADMFFSTRSNVELLCGIYAGLNMRNIPTEYSSLGFRNDRDNGAYFHYFMNDYSTILNTDYVENKIYSYTIQLQLGVRFHQNHRKKHQCHCINQYY